MATVTPARITYYSGDVQNDVRFHGVISEDHEATSEITKYPVQTGFEVSNHAIRKNRRVTIVGIITNTPIQGGQTSYQYSSNNSKTIFEVLESLVNQKVPCEVMTNLGIYNPVVFNRFKTKQAAGSVDSMEFTLSGEELIVAEQVNGAAPKKVAFKKMTEAAQLARVAALSADGVDVCDCSVLTEANIDLGGDFSIANITNSGKAVNTTYICNGQNPTTGAYQYAIHTDDTDYYVSPDDLASDIVENTEDFATESGIANTIDCLETGGADLAGNIANDKITTAMGELTRSLYGAYYGLTEMSDNDTGQALIGLTLGCVVRGVTGRNNKFPYTPGESLPQGEEILSGLAKIGRQRSGQESVNAKGISTSSSILTKIECEC